MLSTPTRRALIGGAGIAAVVAAAPIVAAASPVIAGDVSDPKWQAIVANRHAAMSSWMAASDSEDDQVEIFREQLTTLLPEPTRPPAPSDMLNKTLRELRDDYNDPQHEAAWSAYERDHAAWRKERDALRERIVGPATAHYAAATKAETDALSAVIAYPVQSLTDLGEKAELIVAEWAGCEVPVKHVSTLLADMRRLSNKEA